MLFASTLMLFASRSEPESFIGEASRLRRCSLPARSIKQFRAAIKLEGLERQASGFVVKAVWLQHSSLEFRRSSPALQRRGRTRSEATSMAECWGEQRDTTRSGWNEATTNACIGKRTSRRDGPNAVPQQAAHESAAV